MSPRTEEQNELLRSAARARILDAALTLFGRHGYEGTTVKLIAQEAGVAQGLLYNYFQSKEHLLAEIFQQSMADVRESFAMAEQAAPTERVGALIRSAFAVVRRNERFWRLSYASRSQIPVLAALGVDMAAWTGEIRATVARYFRDAGAAQPEIEAAVLFALIDGVSQHYVLMPEHYPLAEVEALLLEQYALIRG
ncbi:MAG: TetR family transcriptional regulator [Roseiflexaceae bacterium]